MKHFCKTVGIDGLHLCPLLKCFGNRYIPLCWTNEFVVLQGVCNFCKTRSSDHNHIHCLWEATGACWNQGNWIELMDNEVPCQACDLLAVHWHWSFILCPLEVLANLGSITRVYIFNYYKCKELMMFQAALLCQPSMYKPRTNLTVRPSNSPSFKWFGYNWARNQQADACVCMIKKTTAK